jgi:hypothetical protein
MPSEMNADAHNVCPPYLLLLFLRGHPIFGKNRISNKGKKNLTGFENLSGLKFRALTAIIVFKRAEIRFLAKIGFLIRAKKT